MKNLTKVVNDVKKTIGFGLAGAVFLGNMGCATMTPAQKTALLGDALTVFGEVNAFGTKTKGERFANDALRISGSVINRQAQMQESLELANAGRDQIVINNQQPNYQNQSYSQNQNYDSQNNLGNRDNSTPEGFFMYKNWVDFNNDKAAGRDEFIGLNEPVYDISNLDKLWFSFVGRDKIYDGQNLNLKIYSLGDGKTVNYFDKTCTSFKIEDFACESKYFLESGKYKAVLNTSNGRTFSLDFDIIK